MLQDPTPNNPSQQHPNSEPPASLRGPASDQAPHMKIMIFDSICPLCSANARFVIRNDKTKRIHATSTQSELGQILCRRNDIDPTNPTTFVFIDDDDNVFTKSDAALQIAKYLKPPFNILRTLAIIPKRTRDRIYDIVATNRYKIFGKRKTCSIPDKSIRARFIETQSDLAKIENQQTIFETIAGNNYEKLPALLKKLHDGNNTQTWKGTISVERSSNIIGYAIGTLIGLPERMHKQPFDMTFHKENNGQSAWTRKFHNKTMKSLTEVKNDGQDNLMLDTIWPFSIGLKVTVSDNKIDYSYKKSYLFGIEVPTTIKPDITSSEECHGDHITFNVLISIPVIGPISRYYGLLYPPG